MLTDQDKSSKYYRTMSIDNVTMFNRKTPLEKHPKARIGYALQAFHTVLGQLTFLHLILTLPQTQTLTLNLPYTKIT